MFSSCKCAQGFGKRKNSVGMARPKKKKVEMAVPTAEEGAEVEGDARIVGERDNSLHLAAPAASPERVRSAAEQKKWEAALAET